MLFSVEERLSGLAASVKVFFEFSKDVNGFAAANPNGGKLLRGHRKS